MPPTDHTPVTLEDWAGSKHLNLTLVFTDIVDSTSIGVQLSDSIWIENLFLHFSVAREIASKFDCFVVKVIGDSLMMAFRTSTEAVKFAVEFSERTGVEYIGIRVGINSGQVQVRANDIYGLNVNLASRVQHLLTGEGILISDKVKEDYELVLGTASGIKLLEFKTRIKSFDVKTLWRIVSPPLAQAWRNQGKVRKEKFGIFRKLPPRPAP